LLGGFSIVLQSQYRHICQLFMLLPCEDEAVQFRCHTAHLIDMDCPVNIQVINIRPHYLAVVMGASLMGS